MRRNNILQSWNVDKQITWPVTEPKSSIIWQCTRILVHNDMFQAAIDTTYICKIISAQKNRKSNTICQMKWSVPFTLHFPYWGTKCSPRWWKWSFSPSSMRTTCGKKTKNHQFLLRWSIENLNGEFIVQINAHKNHSLCSSISN